MRRLLIPCVLGGSGGRGQMSSEVAGMGVKRLAAILLALFVVPCGMAGAADVGPKEVQVTMHSRADWLELAKEDDAEARGRASACCALRILRAVDPKTGKAYDESNDILGCDPADLRRAFYLEKTEFLLGEPILVEFRIALEGPGEWTEPIGGNYRARGRDDNFLFLMRHEDGTWVGDPYAPIRVYMGGLASHYRVTQGKPESYWLAVQRWCAVDRPGRYDLYCFEAAHDHTVVGRRAALVAGLPDEIKKDHHLDADCRLIDSRTGKPSERYSLAAQHLPVPTRRGDVRTPTPFLDELPGGTVEHAGKTWEVKNTADFAHFRIVVKQGTAAERREMIERWTKIAAGPDDERSWRDRATAARQAIQYAQQDDFLPLIAEWIGHDRDKDGSNFTGVAMRRSRAATELLLKSNPADAVGGMYYLSRERIADVVPRLIEWLAHEDSEARWLAESYLCKWTGQSFGHTWEGSDRQRPTLEEGRAMQPLWRAWWADNKEGFKPVVR